ncbi:oxysterol-binding protein 1 isoform X1 [Schistocerca americana]|uniref:oxysterol-binding protein 1 isoform X1 n=1 Tax=Schistocerca americana TaxID=7009 RepID=UPI001F4FAE34|nr:oxysterol-binding protein 1 isoform X1 [Schistocerca americana]
MADVKSSHSEPEMKGWLFKWTNYLKGYQRRWFVLSNGLLSYYRAENSGGSKLSIRRRRRAARTENQAEMSHTCRGTISLHGALIHTEDSCTFVISNGGTQTFHIKAANEVERQRWVTALELAKAKAIRVMESEEEEEVFDETGPTSQKSDMETVIKTLAAKLEDLQTCSELITKHGGALQRSLSELETLDSTQDVSAKLKSVNERATLFRITSNAMINTCSEYLELAQSQGRKWQRMLQHEREQRLRLEEVVEQLARQHSHLEQAAKEHQIPNQNMPNPTHSSPSDDDDENEFYDAQEENHADGESNFILKIPLGHRRTSSGLSIGSQVSDTRLPHSDGQDEASGSSSEVDDTTETKVLVISTANSTGNGCVDQTSTTTTTICSGHVSSHQIGLGTLPITGKRRQRRTRVPDKPNYPLNLWSIMKNCIGKELTKIPLPVNFSEPLSMLQRLTEDYEYAEILDKAAECADGCEQLAYVAAFTVSSYATTSVRTGKPFNPLLGETFECDRTEDLGWRAVSEQVSHHPPMVAQFCEGRKWRCWQEFTIASKFRGKYLQIIPLGTAHLEFEGSGNHYTWRKVTTTVHNIIVGKLWVDQSGDMDIINHKTGAKCHLKYIPYSYFTRDVQRKVKGCVMDQDGNVKWIVSGTWDNKIEIAPVTGSQGSLENPVFKTGPYQLVWKRRMPPPESERYYNFTELACQLNEPEEGVAPTDSRYRPDQRLMEEGRWDEANAEKLRLEEKQRHAMRQRESAAEKAAADGRPYTPYEPVWFKKEKEPFTGNVFHMYQGQYWACKDKQDWAVCPDIF